MAPRAEDDERDMLLRWNKQMCLAIMSNDEKKEGQRRADEACRTEDETGKELA